MTMLKECVPHPETGLADLRQAVGERTLIAWSLDAVHLLGDRLPGLSGAAIEEGSPRMMLTLLTYCYAAEIYGSEDIEWACRHDAAVRYVCGNEAPDQESLRRFRRVNRPWIEACLMWVHSKAEAANSPATETEVSPLARLSPQAYADLAVLVHRKLELAILIDTAAND
ncbi:MAG: transposase [Verrucomicrobia bacterium]|nr:transposase [Verrucomicrobiota bacterium]